MVVAGFEALADGVSEHLQFLEVQSQLTVRLLSHQAGSTRKTKVPQKDAP